MTEAKIETTKNRKLFLVADDGKIPKKVDFNKKPRVTVNAKFGIITFGKHAHTVLAMNKKFIRFFYDEQQKVIAWKVRESVSQQEMQIGWKLCRADPETGMIQFSIKRLLTNFKIQEGKNSFKGLEIKKYRDYALLGEYEFYYFIDLK